MPARRADDDGDQEDEDDEPRRGPSNAQRRSATGVRRAARAVFEDAFEFGARVSFTSAAPP